MDRAARKLHSSRGAAMVLALVFLLVCVLVGVSVLMAAASNAGRSGSNRQEQQYYLALSSALQLVSDDLQASSYNGNVNYALDTNAFPPNATYTSQDGELTGTGMFSDTSGGSNNLNTSLRAALDNSFDIHIEKHLRSQESSGTTYEYNGFATSITTTPITLDLTPQGTQLNGYTFQITLTVEENLNIILKAAITGAPGLDSYTMEMELRPAEELPTFREPTDPETITTTPVTWIADRVTRPIATPAATGG